MIISDVSLKPYSDQLYYIEDLKSLTRYRFDKVSAKARLKQSVSRLVSILFPELEKLVSTLHAKAVYELLSEFPGAHQIASANLKHLTFVLKTESKGLFHALRPMKFVQLPDGLSVHISRQNHWS